jgi:hypothetical protein
MSSHPRQFGVLCDTGFLIRLNNPKDPLHGNARGYLKFLLEGRHLVLVSTIALAEYAVKDRIENLPMRYFRVLPFNLDHAQKAGDFARIVFAKREQLPPDFGTQRAIIPNDTKMFAQADTNNRITHYLTADRKCEAVLRLLETEVSLRFQFLDLTVPYHQSFGMLDLGG